MYSQEVVVENKTGLHARPAALFVQTAAQYAADITLQKGDKTINAKSILMVLGLGITQGTKISIAATGSDEEPAVNALTELIKSRFGEE